MGKWGAIFKGIQVAVGIGQAVKETREPRSDAVVTRLIRDLENRVEGLHLRNKELQEENDRLRARNLELSNKLDALTRAVDHGEA